MTHVTLRPSVQFGDAEANGKQLTVGLKAARLAIVATYVTICALDALIAAIWRSPDV